MLLIYIRFSVRDILHRRTHSLGCGGVCGLCPGSRARCTRAPGLLGFILLGGFSGALLVEGGFAVLGGGGGEGVVMVSVG